MHCATSLRKVALKAEANSGLMLWGKEFADNITGWSVVANAMLG